MGRQCDADPDFGGLSIWVTCGDAASESRHAAHLRLDPATGMGSGPSRPQRPAMVSGGTQGFHPAGQQTPMLRNGDVLQIGGRRKRSHSTVQPPRYWVRRRTGG